MKAFRMRLEQALGSGAALALLCAPACSDSKSGGSGSREHALTPYPVAGLGCSGPIQDVGYYGQCCAEALCYTPQGESDCAAPSDAPEKLGTSYGSGRCLWSGGDPVRSAVREAFERTISRFDCASPLESIHEQRLEAHGILGARRKHALRAQIMNEVICPALVKLLA